MAVNYERLQHLTFRELFSALVRDNFALDRQFGKHELYRHPDGRRVTISAHQAVDVVRPKILKRIIEDQVRWTEEDLKRLQLLQ